MQKTESCRAYLTYYTGSISHYITKLVINTLRGGNTHMHTNTHTRAHTHTRTRTHTHTHTHTHTQKTESCRAYLTYYTGSTSHYITKLAINTLRGGNTHMHTCTQTHTRAHTHTHAHTHAHTHTHTHTHTQCKYAAMNKETRHDPACSHCAPGLKSFYVHLMPNKNSLWL